MHSSQFCKKMKITPTSLLWIMQREASLSSKEPVQSHSLRFHEPDAERNQGMESNGNKYSHILVEGTLNALKKV